MGMGPALQGLGRRKCRPRNDFRHAAHGVHRLSSNQVLTLWHPVLAKPGTNPNLLRLWQGQDDPRQNWGLAGRYRKALRDPEAMREIIDEWRNDPSLKQHRID